VLSIFIYIHMYTYTYIHTYMYTYMYKRIYIYIYIYVYINTHKCMFIYTCRHTKVYAARCCMQAQGQGHGGCVSRLAHSTHIATTAPQHSSHIAATALQQRSAATLKHVGLHTQVYASQGSREEKGTGGVCPVLHTQRTSLQQRCNTEVHWHTHIGVCIAVQPRGKRHGGCVSCVGGSLSSLLHFRRTHQVCVCVCVCVCCLEVSLSHCFTSEQRTRYMCSLSSLFYFRRTHHVCVCVYVCMCACVCVCVCAVS